MHHELNLLNSNAVSETAQQNENGTQSTPNERGKSQRQAPSIWKVLIKARRKFDAQINKSNQIKFQCITDFMHAEFPDVEKFWITYEKQVDRLLDSKRYESECKKLGIDAAILAQHIVFLGSGTINKVLKNGIEATLGKDITLYKGTLLPENKDVDNNSEK